MPIEVLNPSTVRLLGAGQVITSPDSVVKELIDNALDARASSISIEISANALDVIQVKDSGHGISPDDRHLLCKRYCTSKLRNFAELRTIGGTWLGFRGEALASIAEVAGSITVTTKVESETAATVLAIRRTGDVVSRSTIGAPIGTTIRINNLFAQVPVRKQQWLKEAPKALQRIHKLLHTYALARPSVRFSLRVQGTKGGKSDWTYAPKANANVIDAVMKIIGKDCASNCMEASTELSGYSIQAFLPKPSAAPQHITGKGQFISVDGRPVVGRKGVLKQVTHVFKDRLKTACATLEVVKDPLLWLNITCPTGSYDPNVEPAKDDVIFEDEDAVLAAARQLFEAAYPTNSVHSAGIAGLLDVEPDAAAVKEQSTEKDCSAAGSRRSERIASAQHGSTIDEGRYNQDMLEEEEEPQYHSNLTSNPWVLAKLVASSGQSKAWPTQSETRNISTAERDDREQQRATPTTDGRPLEQNCLGRTAPTRQQRTLLDSSPSTRIGADSPCQPTAGLPSPPPTDLRPRKWSGWSQPPGFTTASRIRDTESHSPSRSAAARTRAQVLNDITVERASMKRRKTNALSAAERRELEVWADEQDDFAYPQASSSRPAKRQKQTTLTGDVYDEQQLPLQVPTRPPLAERRPALQNRAETRTSTLKKPFKVPFKKVQTDVGDRGCVSYDQPSLLQLKESSSNLSLSPSRSPTPRLGPLAQIRQKPLRASENTTQVMQTDSTGMTSVPLEYTAKAQRPNAVVHVLDVTNEHVRGICSIWYDAWKTLPRAAEMPAPTEALAEIQTVDGEIKCAASLGAAAADGAFGGYVSGDEVDMWTMRLRKLLDGRSAWNEGVERNEDTERMVT